MNIKVIHRDVGVEDQSVAAIPPPQSLRLKQDPLLYDFIPLNILFSQINETLLCISQECHV